MSPHQSGGRHKYSKQSYVYQVMILKKTVNKNHPQTNILGQFIINAKKMCKNNYIKKKIRNTNVEAHFVIVILSKEFNEASHFYYYF